jgi:hypothetical protein
MLVPTCHDRLPLSSPSGERTWPFLGKGFSGSEFAVAMDVMQSSGFAGIVIGVSAIAARVAALKRAFNSIAAPTAGISGVRKVASTTGTVNGNTAAVVPREYA